MTQQDESTDVELEFTDEACALLAQLVAEEHAIGNTEATLESVASALVIDFLAENGLDAEITLEKLFPNL